MDFLAAEEGEEDFGFADVGGGDGEVCSGVVDLAGGEVFVGAGSDEVGGVAEILGAEGVGGELEVGEDTEGGEAGSIAGVNEVGVGDAVLALTF